MADEREFDCQVVKAVHSEAFFWNHAHALVALAVLENIFAGGVYDSATPHPSRLRGILIQDLASMTESTDLARGYALGVFAGDCAS